MVTLTLDSKTKNPNTLPFLISISSVNDLLIIPIQILCGLLEICSISSVLYLEVKYPLESLGKVTITSVSYLSNYIGGNVSFLGA